jgi:pilus assembly protein Flp/PilA
MQVSQILLKLRTDERAATAIEYGLIAALIAIAIVGSLDALNGGITDMYGRVDTAVSNNLGNH